jgi:serine protein kinase
MPAEDGPLLEKEYGIPARYLQRILSPWAVKRLEEYGGDIRKVQASSSAIRAC